MCWWHVCVFQDKIKADATDDSLDNPRQNLKEYMDDWFVNQYVTGELAFVWVCVGMWCNVCVCRYGLGPMRKDTIAKFKATLQRHKDSNAYCCMFGRFWGLFDPLDESWCDFYLEWLTLLIEARSAKDETVLPVKNGMAFMVSGGGAVCGEGGGCEGKERRGAGELVAVSDAVCMCLGRYCKVTWRTW